MSWNWKAAAEQPEEKKDYTAMIARAAKKHGVPVGQAMKVAGAEGGANRWIRSTQKNKKGILEPSYGPFQALVGGGDTGYSTGLGNEMLKRGIDPRTDAQAEEYFDVVMETVAKEGWGQWRGADQFAFGGRKNSRGRAHSSGGVIASGEEAPDFNLLPVDDAELAQVDYGSDEEPAADPIEEEEKTLAGVLGLGEVEWNKLFGEGDSTTINEQAEERKENILAMIMNGVESQTSGAFLPGLPGPPGVSFDT